jgi:CRP-like cAMP-binding protein
MNDGFIQAFKRFSYLRPTDILSLFGICSFLSFKKGELLAREGEFCNHAYLIRKGIIRTYVLTESGEERTIRFAKEKDFTSCGASFLHDKPSTEYLEALEDCSVIAFDRARLDSLANENIRILRLTRDGLSGALSEAIDRIEFFTVLSPEQRYRQLLTDRPDLLMRVPQKYLASYLGVTTVSLSRIRNRIPSS